MIIIKTRQWIPYLQSIIERFSQNILIISENGCTKLQPPFVEYWSSIFQSLASQVELDVWSLKHFICSDNSVAWTAFHVRAGLCNQFLRNLASSSKFGFSSQLTLLRISLQLSISDKCLQFVLYENNFVMCALMLHAFQIVPILGEHFWESWEKSHFTEAPEESYLLKSLLHHKFVSTTCTRTWTHILPSKVKTLYLFTIHKFLLGTIQHHHNHPEQLRLNVHQFLPRIIHHHEKHQEQLRLKCSQFSSWDQTSSSQTSGTTMWPTMNQFLPRSSHHHCKQQEQLRLNSFYYE